MDRHWVGGIIIQERLTTMLDQDQHLALEELNADLGTTAQQPRARNLQRARPIRQHVLSPPFTRRASRGRVVGISGTAVGRSRRYPGLDLCFAHGGSRGRGIARLGGLLEACEGFLGFGRQGG